jgi:hypothetical protein
MIVSPEGKENNRDSDDDNRDPREVSTEEYTSDDDM